MLSHVHTTSNPATLDAMEVDTVPVLQATPEKLSGVGI